MYTITDEDIQYCDAITRHPCKKWMKRCTEDVLQEGRLGMVRAAKKFKKQIIPEVDFFGYAKFWIKNQLHRHFFAKVPWRTGSIKSEIYMHHENVGEIIENLHSKVQQNLPELVAQRDLIRKCFEYMPEYMQAALILKCYNGVDFKTFEKIFGIGKGTIRQLLYVLRKEQGWGKWDA